MSQFGEALIGTVLGDKYRLDALLGSGGMGAVYRGWHTFLDVPIAVKVAFRVDGSLGRRFKREARTLMALRHPHIVRMYDYGQDADGHVYMVQEFVDGRPLDALLRAHGRLPANTVVQIGVQTLSALAAAHRSGVVHRDIKPANLMLRGGLDAPRVQLLDFGIAKMRGEGDADQSELTRTGHSPGTPSYMAPEQIQGNAEPASDLYALGVTLFCLLAGYKPYPYGVPKVYLAHLQDPVPALPADVAPALAAIVRRAMAKTPGARYADADEMAAALRSLPRLSIGAVIARPVGAPVAAAHDGGRPDDTLPSGPVDGAGHEPLIGEAERAPWSAPSPRDSAPALADRSGSTSVESRGVIDAAVADQPRAQAGRRWLLPLLLVAGVGLGLGAVRSLSDDGSQPPVVDRGISSPLDAGPEAPPDLAVSDAAVDAAPPADALVLRPVPVDDPPVVKPKPKPKPRRTAKPRGPDRRALARRLVSEIEADLGACRCPGIKSKLARLGALDRSRAEGLRSSYSTRCVVVGLPGGCR